MVAGGHAGQLGRLSLASQNLRCPPPQPSSHPHMHTPRCFGPSLACRRGFRRGMWPLPPAQAWPCWERCACGVASGKTRRRGRAGGRATDYCWRQQAEYCAWQRQPPGQRRCVLAACAWGRKQAGRRRQQLPRPCRQASTGSSCPGCEPGLWMETNQPFKDRRASKPQQLQVGRLPAQLRGQSVACGGMSNPGGVQLCSSCAAAVQNSAASQLGAGSASLACPGIAEHRCC